MATIGTGFSALQANSQARYQARLAERNAGLERDAALRSIENTQTERQSYYRRVSQAKGEARVAAAANGVSLDFGTAADVMSDIDMLAREDIGRINQQGLQNLRGFDIGASNYVAEARASRQAGTAALIKGAFDMGSTALGGAQQYDRLRREQGKKGLFG